VSGWINLISSMINWVVVLSSIRIVQFFRKLSYIVSISFCILNIVKSCHYISSELVLHLVYVSLNLCFWLYNIYHDLHFPSIYRYIRIIFSRMQFFRELRIVSYIFDYFVDLAIQQLRIILHKVYKQTNKLSSSNSGFISIRRTTKHTT